MGIKLNKIEAGIPVLFKPWIYAILIRHTNQFPLRFKKDWM